MKTGVMLALIFLAATAHAAGWQCRNDIEIRCADGNCAAASEDGFTPMSVSFDEGGGISVCAYSGCWEGAGKVLQQGEFLTIAASGLEFSTNAGGGSSADVAVVLDRGDRVALLKVGEFAHPMNCVAEGQSDEETKFVPAGWRIEQRTTGDLNGDGRADTVLQLIKEGSEDDEYNRRLIVLFRESGGGFSKAADAGKILRCSLCGGMLGGGPGDVSIVKGVMTISQMYGSREASDDLSRFRYERSTGRFLMIGEDVTNYDRATGDSEAKSTNFLTGKQVVTKRSVNQQTQKESTTTNERYVKKTKTYLEDVDYNNY